MRPIRTQSRRRVSRAGATWALSLAAALLAWEAEASRPTRVVEPGECLSRIAAESEVSVQDLRRWNDLGDEPIVPGQTLFVGPDPETEEVESYVVVEADTLSCIAARHGVSVDDLLRWNRGVDRNHLRAGEELTIRAAEARAASAPPRLVDLEHVVEQGETLSEIAAAHEVGLDALAAANEIENPDRVRAGARLVIARLYQLTHHVQPGDTIASVAARYGVEPRQIRRWNDGLGMAALRVGASVRVYRERVPSESVGGAACGSLRHPVQLQPHPAFVIRDPERSWATEETVEHLHAAFDAVVARHPDAPRVRVHDLSLPEGGPMADHRSHQSGRDVDIIYYQRRCRNDECPHGDVSPRELDAETQWTLLEHWLRTDAVEMIFIDRSLQPRLYEVAQGRGATEAELRRWFQHPRRGRPVGIIRHFPNHRDHLHVRFACPEGDPLCH